MLSEVEDEIVSIVLEYDQIRRGVHEITITRVSKT